MSTLDVKVEQPVIRSKYFEAKENQFFPNNLIQKLKQSMRQFSRWHSKNKNDRPKLYIDTIILSLANYPKSDYI